MLSRLSLQVVLAFLTMGVASMILVLFVVGGTSLLMSWRAWAAILLIAGLTLPAAYLASRRVLQPLHELTAVAEAISQGHFDRRLTRNNSEEFSVAGAALRRVCESIRELKQRHQHDFQQSAAILQSMADGVLVVDSSHRVTLANVACRAMLGLEADQIEGRPLLELTRLRTLYDAVDHATSRPGVVTTSLTVFGEPQLELLLRASGLPGDPCPGVVVVLHDVTEVRRLENVRKEFVANVSHELKTPLASIKAYAETLLLGAVDDPENNRQFVTRIEEDADRLHALIIDMLQIARVESHPQAFQLRSLEISHEIRRCTFQAKPRADAKQIKISLIESPEPTCVLGDEEGLQTILANLIDNAIKYTPNEGTVTIRWHSEGTEALIEVKDTGLGIEAKYQGRIFERFFRIDQARNRNAGGTGLGLSIVKHLAQAFGGSVNVESSLGTGSTFQVRLPLAKTQQTSD